MSYYYYANISVEQKDGMVDGHGMLKRNEEVKRRNQKMTMIVENTSPIPKRRRDDLETENEDDPPPPFQETENEGFSVVEKRNKNKTCRKKIHFASNLDEFDSTLNPISNIIRRNENILSHS